MNSREKGKRGERLWRDELRAQGYEARRGQQFAGGGDSPDVVSELPFHFEVKFVESLNLRDAMDQARRDAGTGTPVVAHKRSNSPWLVTMLAEDWFKLVRESLPPAQKNVDGCMDTVESKTVNESTAHVTTQNP